VARRDPLYPAFVILLLYGLRRGEVLGLSWRDVDQDQGVIRIRQQLIRAGGRLQLGPVKTSAGRRDLPLLGLADEVLIDQARMRVLGNGSPEWAGQELVFTTRSGNPVEPRNLARSFERLRDAGGLRSIRLHDLRHTTATLLKDLRVPPRDTMEILAMRGSLSRWRSTQPLMMAADVMRSVSSASCSGQRSHDGCCHFCCHETRMPGTGPGTRSVTWVGLDGLEPSTSSLSGKRSNRAELQALAAFPGCARH
jgi:integrase